MSAMMVYPQIQGGYIMDQAEIDYLDSVPALQLWDGSRNINLPTEVHNDEHPYFPNIIDQENTGMCAAAASVRYCFTYEMNRPRPKLSDLNPDALGKNRFTYPEASGPI